MAKHYTFDELSPEVQAQVMARQHTCPHPLWSKPLTWLVNAQGQMGCSGEKGEAIVQGCLECGVHRGVYRPSFWKKDVSFELKQGESLMSKGYVQLWPESPAWQWVDFFPPRPPSCP